MTKTSKIALLLVLRGSLITALSAVNTFLTEIDREEIEEEKQLEFPLFI